MTMTNLKELALAAKQHAEMVKKLKFKLNQPVTVLAAEYSNMQAGTEPKLIIKHGNVIDAQLGNGWGDSYLISYHTTEGFSTKWESEYNMVKSPDNRSELIEFRNAWLTELTESFKFELKHVSNSIDDIERITKNLEYFENQKGIMISRNINRN